MEWKIIFFFLVLISKTIAQVQVLAFTENGPISGFEDAGVFKFFGIPYAQPPINQKRWMSPEEPEPWNPYVLNTSTYGPCCPQTGLPNRISEDCLYLNVYAPPWTPSKKDLYPVMVFIHGGAFVGGCSSQEGFEGDYYANGTNTVMVTLNYRLGALGFFYTGDQIGDITPNLGLQDQIMAMNWVKSNIKIFGGDPSRITLFGQSAGAMSTSIHITSKPTYSQDLFQRAIIESNPLTLRYRTKEEMLKYSYKFGRLSGCSLSDINCLQNLNISQILDAQASTFEIPFTKIEALYALPWEPMIDDVIVTGQPIEEFMNGQNARIPIIIGNVKNESQTFAIILLSSQVNFTFLSKIDWTVFLLLYFGEHSYDLMRLYNVPDGENAIPELITLVNDYLFICPARRVAIANSKQNESTFWYHFMHSPSSDPFCPFPDKCKNPVVCHSAELQFVFKSIRFCPGFWETPEEWQLAGQMVEWWSSFAHGKDPWEEFSSDLQNSMLIDLHSGILNGFDSTRCDYWDTVGYGL